MIHIRFLTTDEESIKRLYLEITEQLQEDLEFAIPPHTYLQKDCGVFNTLHYRITIAKKMGAFDKGKKATVVILDGYEPLNEEEFYIYCYSMLAGQDEGYILKIEDLANFGGITTLIRYLLQKQELLNYKSQIKKKEFFN